MKILDGKKAGDKILRQLKKEIAQEKTKPGLGVVLVGDNKASEIYVELKEEASKKIGMNFRKIKLAKDVSEKKVLEEIEKLNGDKNIHGIIVQLPLPKHLDTDKIISAIDPKKDADGFHKENVKLVLVGKERFVPVFPGAIMKLIEKSGKKLDGSYALVVANSKDFGEMMEIILERNLACAEYILRKDLKKNLEKIKAADFLITACGVPNLIKGAMLKSGAVVIDGGITKKGDKTLGDVDAESCQKLSGFLSPVPGGVGPVTVACLLKNTFKAMEA